MIEVAPAPDELAVSHELRRMILTGCPSRQTHLKSLQQELCDSIPTAGALPRLTLLAHASGMQPQEYACSHSMLAVQRVAAKDGQRNEHGSPLSASFSRRLGMLPQRAGAFVCHACIDEMLEGPGKVSWYRRQHHQVGVDWCDIHGTRLYRVEGDQPFDQLPQVWRDAGKTKHLDIAMDRAPTSGFHTRYIAVLQHLLTRRAPVSCQALNRMIANKAKALGLRTSNKGRRPLLSDHLFDVADHRWLLQHIPEVTKKRLGERFGRIDLIAASYSVAASGDAYAMALAAVFDDVSEAIDAVRVADNSDAVATQSLSPPVVKRMSPQFWHGDIWSLYLQHEGNVARIAAAAGMDRTYLGSKLAEIGLPSLRYTGETGLWRAFLRFKNGSTLIDACAAEGVAIAELERLLRTSSARMAYAAEVVSARHASSQQPERLALEPMQTTVITRIAGDGSVEKVAEEAEAA